jgi:hypothetical protein
MDTVIVTAAATVPTLTVGAAQPASASIPTVEYMSHKFLHWYDGCNEVCDYRVKRNATLAPIAAAFFAGGEEAVIAAASGSSHNDVVCCWELAMTAVYGPVGVHASWKDANGRPTAECLARFSNVRNAVENARANLRTFLGVRD